MKTRLPLLLLFFAMLASSGLVHASNDGRARYSGNPAINGGQDCTGCHDPGPVPTVDLSGPMTVTPGSTNTYTLTISGGPGVSGGLDVSATLGVLSAIMGQGTRVSLNEIVHSAPKAFAGGMVSFSFDWTAPMTTGTATLYGAGLSTDGFDDKLGDGTGLIALMVSVESAPPTNQPPVADPGGPYTGTLGVPIAFDGSASFDPDGTIVSHAWDFGDGAMGSGPTPTHAYTGPGQYTVSLTVTDDGGATNTTTTVADVSAIPLNQPPVAFVGGPYSGLVGVPVAFDGSGSYDPDGTITSYAWDLGDGFMDTGVSVEHTYAGPGVYRVTLTVMDDDGASASDATDVVVRDAGASPLPVYLSAPRWVKVGGDGKDVKIRVTVDLSSLPPGTTGCGTATLFKNGVPVATESLCVKGKGEKKDDDDDDDDDGDDDDDDDDDDDQESKRERKTLRVKTRHGVVATVRPGQLWARAKFEVELTLADVPSVVWIAQVEFGGWTGESAPVTTQVRR